MLCCIILAALAAPQANAASVTACWTSSSRQNISTSSPEATLAGRFNISGTVYTSDMYSFTAEGVGEHYTVTFDACGGTVSPGSKSVVYGGTYGTLPVPIRAGYRFTDWSPDQSGTIRQTCKSSSQVATRANHTLYAMWEANQYTVTLQANGGSVSTNRITVTYRDNYGDLPAPTRSGYSFDGWYTLSSGGTQITSSSTVSQTEDHTLYAHWTQTAKAPRLSDLTYSFGNSCNAYGYPSSYRIPLARYQLIFGNTALAQSIYNSAGYWGGNCYGMSSTSSMFFRTGNDVSVSGFKQSASPHSALSINDRNGSWSLTVKEFIEALHVSQYGSEIQRDYQKTATSLTISVDQLQRELDLLCSIFLLSGFAEQSERGKQREYADYKYRQCNDQRRKRRCYRFGS